MVGGAPYFAKLVHITPISLWFMVDISIVTYYGSKTNKQNWESTTLHCFEPICDTYPMHIQVAKRQFSRDVCFDF